MSENTPIRFFLGSNSPQGFVSRFDQLDCGDPCSNAGGGAGVVGATTGVRGVGG